MKPEHLEMKYKQLLKNHHETLKDVIINIKANTTLQNLITDLAIHMNLKDVGKLTPQEIIESAKGRITKIHIVS